MEITLSPRLLCCARFIRQGQTVADIGCDHGYLGIYLLKKNIAKAIIASDINQGPLNAARRNAILYGVHDRMSFYLCDGVSALPQDFDTLVCAGMGGDAMVSILSAAPWLQSSNYRLILQCQTKAHILRQYLWDNGWDITEEMPVRDGRFVYTVMEVCRGEYLQYTPGHLYCSPALASHSSPDKIHYIQKMIKALSLSVSGKGASATPTEVNALKELKELI